MKQRKILISALLFLSSSMPLICQADVTFYVQTPEQITGLIKQNGCPAGYGYIPTGTRVEINNYYIPQNQRWYWVYNGNDHCQPLPKMGLSYLNYHATGNYSGDQIITGYGDKNNGETLFSFVFTIPPSNCPDNQCPWYCHNFVGSNPPTIIGCAQDI